MGRKLLEFRLFMMQKKQRRPGREVLRYLKTGKEKEIAMSERVCAFFTYLKFARKFDVVDMSRIKYLGSCFLKGFEGASVARAELMKLKTV